MLAAILFSVAEEGSLGDLPFSWLNLRFDISGRCPRMVQGHGIDNPWVISFFMVACVRWPLNRATGVVRISRLYLSEGSRPWAARRRHCLLTRFGFFPGTKEQISVRPRDSETCGSSGLEFQTDPSSSVGRVAQYRSSYGVAQTRTRNLGLIVRSQPGYGTALHPPCIFLDWRHRALVIKFWFPRSSRFPPSWFTLSLGDTQPLAVPPQLYLYGGFVGWFSPALCAFLYSPVSCAYFHFLLSMDSELLHSMENLQFTEAESVSVVMEPPCDDGDGDSALWLVGSVISNKTVNGDSVCHIFRSVWKSKHVSEILELQPNFFLIKPVGEESKAMILKRRPWVVHDDLFSIEPYIPSWRAVDFNFNNMVIWVLVFQLPLRAMNGTMGLQLGGCIGKAVGVDHRVEGGNLGEFLRIRVSINITKPLRRCVLLGNGQGRKPSPCPLKYERLPRFCYYCGLLGHDLAVCLTKPTDLDTRKLQYGSWLRVSVQKPVVGSRRKQGIEYFDMGSEASGTPAAATDVAPPPCTGSVTSQKEGANMPPVAATEGDPLFDDMVQSAHPDPTTPTKTTTDNVATAMPTRTAMDNVATAMPTKVAEVAESNAAAALLTKTAEDTLGFTEVDASKMTPVDPFSPNVSAPELAKTGLCPTNVNISVSSRVSKRTLQGKYEELRPGFVYNGQSNRILWRGHDSGTYAVRSGYFYLRRPPLPVCRPSPLWKAIKQLPTLPKVCIFAWRLGQDCLLIGSRVWAAGLGDGLCPLCSSVVETPLHAFRDCTDAVEALRLGGFPDAVISSSASTMLDWLVASAGLLSRSDFAKLLLLLWNMWNRRNSLVHGSQPQPVWATVTSAALLHADYLAANDQSRRPVSTTVFSPGVWSPPPLGTVVVSVDGAFSLDQGAVRSRPWLGQGCP
ncbi:hypothetical protein V6N11_035749 [Hibiscus sabdariffa]|uniref:DUF4283 domain-containing protein n=1 Tax=Hibiscus sabdariffa TaxID=183260 RepID=A0ABR2R8U4_9ROSI